MPGYGTNHALVNLRVRYRDTVIWDSYFVLWRPVRERDAFRNQKWLRANLRFVPETAARTFYQSQYMLV